MQETNLFDLKGQARRLRAALATELGVSVTHATALNLVARAHGARNWEALQAEYSVQAPVTASPQPATSDERWLCWLEAAIRFRERAEEDVDELVHDITDSEQASNINNSGLYAQLAALLAWHAEPQGRRHDPRKALVAQLEAFLDVALPLPESTFGYGPSQYAIPLRVNIHLNSSLEGEEKFDALEWFANHPEEAVSRLVVDGLRNSSLSDEVALWLEEHSEDLSARQRLHALLTRMRTNCAADRRPTSDLVGITVFLDEEAVARHVKSRQATGEAFAPAALAALGIKD